MRLFLIIWLAYLGSLIEQHWQVKEDLEGLKFVFGLAVIFAVIQDIKEVLKVFKDEK